MTSRNDTAPARNTDRDPGGSASGSFGGRVLVLNPNSDRAVTDALEAAALGWGRRTGVTFETAQLDQAPKLICSAADHALVAPLVDDYLANPPTPFDVAVVACHGDPGVATARSRIDVPVLGIGEVSLRAAAAAGRFGVVALSEDVLESKWNQIVRAGTENRCAGVRPMRIGAADPDSAAAGHPEDETPTAREETWLLDCRDAALELVDAGAQILVLGCAAMGPLAGRIARAVGVPVIDPTRAAADLAASLVLCESP